jgi:ferric-dicitrate binding protein FerR (iron transport regulator)
MITTRLSAAGVFLLAMLGSEVSAQQIPGCTSTILTDPPRTAFRCDGGLLIEAEAFAVFEVSTSRLGGAISSIELKSRAILVELTRRRRFQILTPHAIASVRGTIYAVDVFAAQTSVFVARGRTRVMRRDRAEVVDLGRGEGVDVAQGEPLVVRRWPPERAAVLLGRFGRRGPAR